MLVKYICALCTFRCWQLAVCMFFLAHCNARQNVLKEPPQLAKSNSVLAPSSPSGAVAQAAVGDKGNETHPL